jgi:hypothetical protein
MLGMAHVQSKDVCAFLNQVAQHFRSLRRGTERADDFGFSHQAKFTGTAKRAKLPLCAKLRRAKVIRQSFDAGETGQKKSAARINVPRLTNKLG